MDYTKLCNFEINKLVAEKLGILVPVPQGFESKVIGDALHYYDDNRILFSCHLDYCDNPTDAYQIIIDSGISFALHGKVWIAWADKPVGCSGKTQVREFSYHGNPLRAAMEVFLKIGDSE